MAMRVSTPFHSICDISVPIIMEISYRYWYRYSQKPAKYLIQIHCAGELNEFGWSI